MYSTGTLIRGCRHPFVVWLDRGNARLIQALESSGDLFRRDHLLVKLAETG